MEHESYTKDEAKTQEEEEDMALSIRGDISDAKCANTALTRVITISVFNTIPLILTVSYSALFALTFSCLADSTWLS